MSKFIRGFAALVLVALAGVAALVAGRAAAANPNSYTVTNLVSDGGVPAIFTDPALVNAWGLDAGPLTPWWVADNGTGVSTIYTGDGTKVSLAAGVDQVAVDNDPTGLVFNGSDGFVVRQQHKSGPAKFIFSGEAGTILGWNPTVNLSTAVLGADRSGVGAVYKGLAILGDRLYATDFRNGRVDVFDSSFNLVAVPGAFVDPMLSGYAPFGVRTLNGNIFVTYGKKQPHSNDEADGAGLGFVDEYSPTGALITRVASQGALNAPWGLAFAPAHFGSFSGDLLVGNFGDGRISAYAPTPSGFLFRGQLHGSDGQPIAIDGLWALGFGNGNRSGPTNSLYFTAGPNGEADGLFGSIRAG